MPRESTISILKSRYLNMAIMRLTGVIIRNRYPSHSGIKGSIDKICGKLHKRKKGALPTKVPPMIHSNFLLLTGFGSRIPFLIILTNENISRIKINIRNKR